MNRQRYLAIDPSASVPAGSWGAGRGDAKAVDGGGGAKAGDGGGGAKAGDGGGCEICNGGNGLIGSWGGFFFLLLLKPPLEDFTTSLKNLSIVWASAPMLTATIKGGAKRPVSTPSSGDCWRSEGDKTALLLTSDKETNELIWWMVAALALDKLMTRISSISWKENKDKSFESFLIYFIKYKNWYITNKYRSGTNSKKCVVIVTNIITSLKTPFYSLKI